MNEAEQEVRDIIIASIQCLKFGGKTIGRMMEEEERDAVEMLGEDDLYHAVPEVANDAMRGILEEFRVVRRYPARVYGQRTWTMSADRFLDENNPTVQSGENVYRYGRVRSDLHVVKGEGWEERLDDPSWAIQEISDLRDLALFKSEENMLAAVERLRTESIDRLRCCCGRTLLRDE